MFQRKTNLYFSATVDLFSANAFNLDQSKILSFGNELTATISLERERIITVIDLG